MGLTNDDHEKNDTTSVFHWNANSASFKTVSKAYAERLRTRAYFAEAK